MNRGMLVGRWKLSAPGILLVFAITLGTLPIGCGSGEEVAESNPPSTPEEADNLVVRVSGTEGVAYSGNYGTLAEEPELVKGTLDDQPTEYEVEVPESNAGGVTAQFQKTQSGAGALKVEILADGEVAAESTTYVESGSVIVDWLPQLGATGEEILPQEGLPEEENSPKEEKK